MSATAEAPAARTTESRPTAKDFLLAGAPCSLFNLAGLGLWTHNYSKNLDNVAECAAREATANPCSDIAKANVRETSIEVPLMLVFSTAGVTFGATLFAKGERRRKKDPGGANPSARA